MSVVRERRYYLEIFLVSFAALLLEISYTRVFSFKVFYFFTYLIIGVALLGIGSGGIFMSVLPRLRQCALPKLIGWCSLIGGTFTGLGYFVIAFAPVRTLHAHESPLTIVMLLAMSLTLYVSYLCVGLVISGLFAHFPKRINRLYFADLVGAGLSCALVIPLMNQISPPGCVFLAALLLLATGVRSFSIARLPWKLAYAASAMFLAGGTVWPSYGIDPRVDENKTLQLIRTNPDISEFAEWGAVFRLDVSVAFPSELLIDHITPDGTLVTAPPVRINSHDGMAGSSIYGATGPIEGMEYFDYEECNLPFTVVGPNPSVLIIGAAGGHEVMASIRYGASSIEGVELNPVTHAATTGPYADFTGRAMEHPKVSYINAEGRSYLARQSPDKKYDIIYFVAPDSYAAMNAATAGAFVMAESYLYTVEAIVEAMKHVSDDGVLCMQFGEFAYGRRPNRTTRYLASAREALSELGIENFNRHVFVSTSKLYSIAMSTILLSKSVFTPEDAAAFQAKLAQLPRGNARYIGETPERPSPVTNIITMSDEEVDRFIAEYPYNISPVRDNSPFFWHFVHFRDLPLWRDSDYDLASDYEEAYGEQVLVLLLIMATTLGAIFMLLPLALIRKQWFGFRYKLRSFLFFAALGTGFMLFEIPLIQKLTLYLGYPTYSLTVTLMAILIFSGIGSMLSERYMKRTDIAAVVIAAVLVLLTIFYSELLAPFLREGVGAPLALRVAITIALVAPVGLTLGALLPMGMATFPRTSEHRNAYIA